MDLEQQDIPLTSLNIHKDCKAIQHEPRCQYCTIKNTIAISSLLLGIFILVLVIVKFILIATASLNAEALQPIDTIVKLADNLNSAILILQPTGSNSKPIVIKLNRTGPVNQSLLSRFNESATQSHL